MTWISAASTSFDMPSLARDISVSDSREVCCEPTSLALTLGPLRQFLQEPQITEICVNRPGSVFLETSIGWQYETLPELDLDWCSRFAKLVANYTRQRVDATSPLLSGSLPGGERVQLVLPPATSTGCVAISIRRPAAQLWSLEQLAER